MSEALKTRLWNKDWKYVPSGETDIRVTFNRIRAQQQKQQRMHPVERKTRA
jgi:hypothetical protein